MIDKTEVSKFKWNEAESSSEKSVLAERECR